MQGWRLRENNSDPMGRRIRCSHRLGARGSLGNPVETVDPIEDSYCLGDMLAISGIAERVCRAHHPSA